MSGVGPGEDVGSQNVSAEEYVFSSTCWFSSASDLLPLGQCGVARSGRAGGHGDGRGSYWP